MRILPDGITIEVSNSDLEPRTRWWRFWEYSKLDQEVISALRPKVDQQTGTLRFSRLHVKKGTRRFQLPGDLVLLALKGWARVMVPGTCGIWYCEMAHLKADLAVLGAGKVRRLTCGVVSLQPKREVLKSLNNIRDCGPDRLRVDTGRIEYLLHAQQDPEDRQYEIGAEIDGSGIMGRLKIQNVDEAIILRGNVFAKWTITLKASLRDLIHDLLWESDSSTEWNRQIEQMLTDHGVLKNRCTVGGRRLAAIPDSAESRAAWKGEGQKPLDQIMVPKTTKQKGTRRIVKKLIGR